MFKLSPRARLALAGMLALVAPVSAQATDLLAVDAYRPGSLTDTPRTFTNFNREVTEGFFVTDSLKVFAINSWASTLNCYDLLEFLDPETGVSLQPAWRVLTLGNPVACLEGANSDLFVVGGSTYGVARYDLDGDLLAFARVGDEPGSAVVDPGTNSLWVSCMGDNEVWQLDWTTLAVTQVWSVPLTRPRDLFLDAGGKVCVSASISGNNTFPARLRTSANAEPELEIWDGYDATMFPSGGLPDVDVVRIDAATNTVEDLVRGAMSLLHQSKIHPITGDLWTVGTEHHNVTPSSEPALRGEFATNTLAITQLSGPFPVMPTTITDVDAFPPNQNPLVPDELRTQCNPVAIAFEPGSGLGFSSAEGSFVLAAWDPAGNRLPYDYVLLDPANPAEVLTAVRTISTQYFLAAYCQEGNKILIFFYDTTPAFADAVLDLGPDPTPAAVKNGRSQFTSGIHSKVNRTSCASCHPGGGADGLCWDISDAPVDDKGPMVTQTLFGIEDSQPHHWRGERSLLDFNVAFPGLLGGDGELSGADMRDVEAFIYSLRTPANHTTDNDRMVKDANAVFDEADLDATTTISGVGDATAGQALFFEKNTDLGTLGTCITCHQMPTGSNGHAFGDPTIEQITAREHFEPTQLNNQFALKDQPLVPVATAFDGTPRFQRGGVGALHDGTVQNFLRFAAAFQTLDDPEALSLNAFQRQIDTGTARVVHDAVRYEASVQSPSGATLPMGPLACPTPANPSTVEEEIRCIIGHTGEGWNGAVAIGTYPHPTEGLVRTSWWYDPLNGKFVNENPARFPDQTWTDFYAATTNGADNLFLGVAPANERRFAADPDNDQLDGEQEVLAGGDPWRSDTDGDLASDGNEYANGGDASDENVLPNDTTAPSLVAPIGFEFATATGAKFVIRTDEPTKLSFTLSSNNGAAPVLVERSTFETVHTVTAGGLVPSVDSFNSSGFIPGGVRSQTYSGGSVVLEDENGLTTTVALPTFNTESATDPAAVIDTLELLNQNETGLTYTAQLSIRLANGVAPTASPMPPYVPAQRPNFYGGTQSGVLMGIQVLRLVNDDWELVDMQDITVISGGAVVPDFTVIDPGYIDVHAQRTFGALPAGLPFLPLRQYSELLDGDWILTDTTDLNGDILVDLAITRQVSGEKLRFVPKFAAERIPDGPTYNFAAFPFVFNSVGSFSIFQGGPNPNVPPSVQRKLDPTCMTDCDYVVFNLTGNHMLSHYDPILTKKANRDVTSSDTMP